MFLFQNGQNQPPAGGTTSVSSSMAIVLAVLLLSLAGCRSSAPAPAPAPAGPSDTSITLLEQQLLEVIDLEQALDADAALPDADYREIQRQFESIAQLYRGILARNPDSLETHLLYGKLLSRYGDREGARDQFLLAAKIDPAIAVIHQQLSTYYAEEEDITRALAYALNAVRLEPETAAYHFGLGQVLAAFRQKFIDEEIFSPEKIDADMLQAFVTAKDLQPDSLELQFRYGEAFYDAGNPDWSIALAHWQALATNPALSPLQLDATRLHQARCLVSLGRPEEASAIAHAVTSPELQGSAQALGL